MSPTLGHAVDGRVAAYRNLLKGEYPAFATKGEISSTAKIDDSKKQSQDRYVIETTNSRIKDWDMLVGIAPWAHVKYLNRCFKLHAQAQNCIAHFETHPIGRGSNRNGRQLSSG